MNIEWSQWTPDLEAHNMDDPMHGMRLSREDFLRKWESWKVRFPGKCKALTLTGDHWGNGVFQLRAWFEDCFDKPQPMDYHSRRHVDSCGHGLIADIGGSDRDELYKFALKLLEGLEYREPIDKV